LEKGTLLKGQKQTSITRAYNADICWISYTDSTTFINAPYTKYIPNTFNNYTTKTVIW